MSAGAIYNVPVRLNVAQLEASVEVSAAAVTVETTSTTLTSVLSTRTVQDLPLNGRDFSQMLALTPGYSGYEGGGSASINGSRSNQFNWQIEGTDNNDQWFNIKAVNQGGINSIPGVLLPLDSVEEYSVQTQAAAGDGTQPRRRGQPDHQVGHQPAARQRVLLQPQRSARRAVAVRADRCAQEQTAQRALRLLARRSDPAGQDVLLHDLRRSELRHRQPGAGDRAVGGLPGGGAAVAAAVRGPGESGVASRC